MADPVAYVNELLLWVFAGGGATAIASFVLERMVWYQQLTSNQRRLVFAGVAVVLGLGSYAITQFVPTEIINAIAPYVAIAVAIGVPIISGTVAHKIDPAAKPKG